MTQVFIACVCSVIKNSREIGLFIDLFAFSLFFHICSAFLFMVLTLSSQLVPNGKSHRLEFFWGYCLGIYFNCYFKWTLPTS